jgi:hypothetical protein
LAEWTFDAFDGTSALPLKGWPIDFGQIFVR